MHHSIILDSALAAAAAGTTVQHLEPGNNTTTILMALITGVIAPIAKEIILSLHRKHKERKNEGN